MATITRNDNILIDINKLRQEYTLVEKAIKDVTTINANIVEVSDGNKHLQVNLGLDDNGMNTCITKVEHWMYDGLVWAPKAYSRLKAENATSKRFLESQSFQIWTQVGKYCKIVNNTIVYLDPVKDIDTIFVEQKDGNGNSYSPKQYTTTVKSDVLDAYVVNENTVRPQQMAYLKSLWPAVGQTLTF